MRHTIRLAPFALAGLLLTPLVARADHEWHDDDDRWNQQPAYEQVPVQQQVQPQVPPPAPAGQPGRYELRTVAQWVPGHYEQVWVPQRCHVRPFHWRRTRCVGGYYDQQWIAASQVQAQQWVWVPAPAAYPPAAYRPASYPPAWPSR